MADRKGLSKKLRFEIFKRDSFTCQYCGKQPPLVVLVVDHINPVANGGDNDDLNLITSCEECNQGKGARLLERIINRPDADLEWLEMQQEITELRRYQMAKSERSRLEEEIIVGFQQYWWDAIDIETAPSKTVFLQWLTWAAPDQIEEAMKITAAKASYQFSSFDHELRYCAACLRNITGTRR
jgi:hypothetical protein